MPDPTPDTQPEPTPGPAEQGGPGAPDAKADRTYTREELDAVIAKRVRHVSIERIT